MSLASREGQQDLNPEGFSIGTIPIRGNLFLAPMDGITDSSFRSLARQFGAAASITEFINASDVIYRYDYAKKRLGFREVERPIFFQLYDDDPERIVKAATQLLPLQPDGFDINMGCCAPSVANRGAGAGLLRQPEKVALIFSRLSRLVNLPITGKIRLGWDETNRNHVEIARIIQDNGGSLVSVHARTHQQKYSGKADWEAIKEVKQSVSIPVIGNGDVGSCADIESMFAASGCDGVMIGRAALANPWLFSGYERHEVSIDMVQRALQLHFEYLAEDVGKLRGLILLRKFTSRYLAPYHLESSLRKELLTQTYPDQFFKLLDKVLREVSISFNCKK
jgi:nifR3 family TIM-barrel protein